MELHNLFERCVLGLRDSAILCLEISFLHDKTERVSIYIYMPRQGGFNLSKKQEFPVLLKLLL